VDRISWNASPIKLICVLHISFTEDNEYKDLMDVLTIHVNFEIYVHLWRYIPLPLSFSGNK